MCDKIIIHPKLLQAKYGHQSILHVLQNWISLFSGKAYGFFVQFFKRKKFKCQIKAIESCFKILLQKLMKPKYSEELLFKKRVWKILFAIVLKIWILSLTVSKFSTVWVFTQFGTMKIDQVMAFHIGSFYWNYHHFIHIIFTSLNNLRTIHRIENSKNIYFR